MRGVENLNLGLGWGVQVFYDKWESRRLIACGRVYGKRKRLAPRRALQQKAISSMYVLRQNKFISLRNNYICISD